MLVAVGAVGALTLDFWLVRAGIKWALTGKSAITCAPVDGLMGGLRGMPLITISYSLAAGLLVVTHRRGIAQSGNSLGRLSARSAVRTANEPSNWLG